MPPDPPRKARASPSQWSLRDHCLTHITSQVSRLQLSKSWQVWLINTACWIGSNKLRKQSSWCASWHLHFFFFFLSSTNWSARETYTGLLKFCVLSISTIPFSFFFADTITFKFSEFLQKYLYYCIQSCLATPRRTERKEKKTPVQFLCWSWLYSCSTAKIINNVLMKPWLPFSFF